MLRCWLANSSGRYPYVLATNGYTPNSVIGGGPLMLHYLCRVATTNVVYPGWFIAGGKELFPCPG